MVKKMKAKNDYVIIEPEIQGSGKIMMKENNVGRVLSCLIEPDLEGKVVIFSTEKAIQEYDGVKFVPYDKIMAVIE
ncbi:MAG: hypothetical protein CM15mV62_650 [uncultured marine virus]|nr:MAG: hypothetical protein CM15mV62_650 [uncultured marine virus]